MPIIYFQLLIGFESGAIVLWDLKNKTADSRYSSPEVGENYELLRRRKMVFGFPTRSDSNLSIECGNQCAYK